MLDPVLADLDFAGDDGVILFVNSMGATPLIELYVMYSEFAAILDKAGVRDRPLAGRARTSPASTWPAARSRCCAPTTNCCGCGTTRSTRRRCGGDAEWPTRPSTWPLLTGWVREFARVIGENAQLLTDLDAAIGDADHGINMDRGMTAVIGALDEAAPADMSALCKQVGMTLVKSVGGASGPLYGTFFLRMAPALGTADSVDAADFAKALRAGVEGVVQRGRAEAGDKTMFDALAPALDALDAALASGGRARRRTGRTPPSPPKRAATQPNRWSRARAGPATSGSAASVTRIRARRRRRC